MYFLIRCVFWLGLVFMALPWDGASLRADLSSGTEEATRLVAREAQALCARDPIGCASKAISAGNVFEAAPSQNTLRPTDLAPAWRGPVATAARRQPG